MRRLFLSLTYLIFFGISAILLGLFLYSSLPALAASLASPEIWFAILLSLGTSVISTVICIAFAIRSLDLEQVFVPLVDEGKARTLRQVPDVGMQAGDAPPALDPKVIIVMGGLSMPNVPVEAGQVRKIIDSHPGAKVVGICFMQMFEKAGWLSTISFDCLIDATIDPVEVTRKS